MPLKSKGFQKTDKKQKPVSSSCSVFKTYLNGEENWSPWWI